MIHLINLSDFIEVCVKYPRAACELFIVGDNHDFSAAEIIRMMGAIISIPARVFRFPRIILTLFFTLPGRKKLVIAFC